MYEEKLARFMERLCCLSHLLSTIVNRGHQGHVWLSETIPSLLGTLSVRADFKGALKRNKMAQLQVIWHSKVNLKMSAVVAEIGAIALN